MKKRISVDGFKFGSGKLICKFANFKSLKFQNSDEMSKFLKMIKFLEINLERFSEFYTDLKFGLNSPLKNLWLNAMESLENLAFTLTNVSFESMMEILPKLSNLKQVSFSNDATPDELLEIINVLPKFPSLYCFAEMDDEFLKLLALKTSKSNPLKKLLIGPSSTFSINAVEQFFKTAAFADSSIFLLEIRATLLEIEEMFGRIGGYEVDSLKNDNGAITTKLKKISDKSCTITVIAVSKDS
uniref:Uncharacterized protein n=1 Tax=Panagrolaimus sp. JU765 TaxID=591449 RepID=A0AC34QMR0_9BILA